MPGRRRSKHVPASRKGIDEDWDCRQCTTVTNGKRCKRTTCKYSHHCWQHTQKRKGVTIQDSAIKGAGTGLFATREIPKNSIVTYADKGRDFLTVSELQRRYPNPSRPPTYALCKNNRPDGLCADARSTQSGIARYINHRPRSRANTSLHIGKKRGKPYAEARATKRIRAGTELTAPYGSQYHINNRGR